MNLQIGSMTPETVKIYKEISAIPTPYVNNGIYFVRVGNGFDLYVADSTGTVVHSLNTPKSNLDILVNTPGTIANGQQWVQETDTTGAVNFNNLGFMHTEQDKKHELCVSVNGTIKKTLIT